VSGDVGQCSRGSQALFFDYYSGTQKNIFPLNEACTRPLGHYLLCARSRRREVARAFRRIVRATACEFFGNAQNHDSTRGFATSAFASRPRRKAPSTAQAASPMLAEALGARGIEGKKFFGKMSAREHLGGPNPTRIARIASK
jgi:hypothetical protein